MGPSDDIFYGELTAKYATVKRFLPTLLRVIQFEGNASARPLLEALNWLRERPGDDVRAFTFGTQAGLRWQLRRSDASTKPSTH